METASDVSVDRQGQHDRSCPRRVGVIWALLFFNVLDPAGGAVVPIPHKVAQLIDPGCIVHRARAGTDDQSTDAHPTQLVPWPLHLARNHLAHDERSLCRPRNRLSQLPLHRVSLRAVAPHSLVGSARPARAAQSDALPPADPGLGRSGAAYLARKGARWPSERHALADPADTGRALRSGARGPDDTALVLPPRIRPSCPHARCARPHHSCAHPHTHRPHRDGRWLARGGYQPCSCEASRSKVNRDSVDRGGGHCDSGVSLPAQIG